MMHAYHPQSLCDDRYLLIDDTDEDATEILSVVCEHSHSSQRAFAEFLATGYGGRA